ncbi:hypothetical protein KCP70_06380 [Salmonella enterica subsp. enterica]|nr:hypothetical protein KCP70_06380 [Salmonella enterica subsp. enterica]
MACCSRCVAARCGSPTAPAGIALVNMPGGERALSGLHCLCKPGSAPPGTDITAPDRAPDAASSPRTLNF